MCLDVLSFMWRNLASLLKSIRDSKMLELRVGCCCCWMFEALLYNNCKTCRWYINIAMEKCGQTLSPDFAFDGNKRNYLLNSSVNVLSFAFNNTGSSQIMRFVTLYLFQNPGACLFTRTQSMLSCEGSHLYTRRLCPCA